jgi:haloalkane dehalogenase
MAYVEVGQGDPIVLLHGNPTSSYLWRNVLPHLQPLGRCIAPDLIGMGDSDKLPNSGPGSYRFVEHRRYLDALLEELGVRERVTLVVHDWGSGLGFDWANRHREAVRGIAYMEAILRPRGWELPQQYQQMILMLRSPAGEAMSMEQNLSEQVMIGGVLRHLGEQELAEYRRPFANPGEDRRPPLSWARENPVHGEPADVAEIVKSYSEWLPQSSVPKLFVNGGTNPATNPALHIATRLFKSGAVPLEYRGTSRTSPMGSAGARSIAWAGYCGWCASSSKGAEHEADSVIVDRDLAAGE